MLKAVIICNLMKERQHRIDWYFSTKAINPRDAAPGDASG